jgi:hypothetical protein
MVGIWDLELSSPRFVLAWFLGSDGRHSIQNDERNMCHSFLKFKGNLIFHEMCPPFISTCQDGQTHNLNES